MSGKQLNHLHRCLGMWDRLWMLNELALPPQQNETTQT